MRRVDEIPVPDIDPDVVEPVEEDEVAGLELVSLGTETARGSFHCSTVLWASETPSCPYTYWTSPEQSKPVGLAPAHTYGTPRYCTASDTTPPCPESSWVARSCCPAAEANEDRRLGSAPRRDGSWRREGATAPGRRAASAACRRTPIRTACLRASSCVEREGAAAALRRALRSTPASLLGLGAGCEELRVRRRDPLPGRVDLGPQLLVERRSAPTAAAAVRRRRARAPRSRTSWRGCSSRPQRRCRTVRRSPRGSERR